jgi:hypothetical protein
LCGCGGNRLFMELPEEDLEALNAVKKRSQEACPEAAPRSPFPLQVSPALPCRGFNAGRYPYFQKREACQFVGKLLVRGIGISR